MYKNAREFCERILTAEDPVQYICAFAGEERDPVWEEDWLEFKAPRKSSHLRGSWAKALSAMLNSGGGAVIWGVTCKPVEDPIAGGSVDAVSETPGVNSSVQLKGRLSDLLPNAVEPLPVGVDIRVVRREEGGPEFVICLIPDGESKPYMATCQKRFFIRSGRSSNPAPLALLRLLFNPKLSADLRPVLYPRIESGKRKIDQISVFFDLAVENIGRCSARHPEIVFVPPTQMLNTLSAVEGMGQRRNINMTTWEHYIETGLPSSGYMMGRERHVSRFPVLCGNPSYVTTYSTTVPLRRDLPAMCIVEHVEPFIFEIRVNSEDSPSTCYVIRVSAQDIVDRVGRVGTPCLRLEEE